jgi:sensor c-di-GMP phosphodiesterase-like protein
MPIGRGCRIDRAATRTIRATGEWAVDKGKATVLIAGLVAITAPILAALHLARQQSLDDEAAQAGLVAREILWRSDETSAQVSAAFAQLRAAGGGNPCSDERIALMREIDVGSSRLQAVGYVDGDRLLCSSLGRHGTGIALGPVSHRDAHGTELRTPLSLPFAPGIEFTVSTDSRSGYAAIVHRDRPLDVSPHHADLSFGLVVYSSGKPILGRGSFRPEWLRGLASAPEARLFDGRHVVVAARSQRYDHATYAAIPASHLAARTRHAALVLVPVGIVAGLLLLFTVLYLARQQASLPAMLRSALRREEFFLVYQPVVDLHSGAWVGAEALIRWQRPDGELIRPDLFIPVAEEVGLVRQLTRKVLDLVARDAPAIMRRHPHFHIGINLSQADLQSGEIVGQLRELTQRMGVAPERILVEATEHGFLDAALASQVVHDIRALGMRVAIDDFGTGYSSLSYLTTFAVDFLKIDKSFVETIGTDSATSQVVTHIIEMAKSLNLALIAEGVETEAQARFLREQGVRFAQGWLFARPMPSAALAHQLYERSRGRRPLRVAAA